MGLPSKVFLQSLAAALKADQSWDPETEQFESYPTRGMEAFAKIYAGWGVGSSFYREAVYTGLGYCSVEDFVDRSYVDCFAGSEPLDLLAMIDTWYRSDFGAAGDKFEFQVMLGQLASTPTLLLPCTEDRYFDFSDAKAEAEMIPGALLKPIVSSWGHRAGDPHRPGQHADAAFLDAELKSFLNSPTKHS